MRLGGGLVRGCLAGLGDDLGQLVRIVVVVPLVLEFERLVIIAPFPARQPRLPGFVATREGLVEVLTWVRRNGSGVHTGTPVRMRDLMEQTEGSIKHISESKPRSQANFGISNKIWK